MTPQSFVGMLSVYVRLITFTYIMYIGMKLRMENVQASSSSQMSSGHSKRSGWSRCLPVCMEVGVCSGTKLNTKIAVDAVKSKDTDPERDSWAIVEESEDGIPMLPNLPAGARSEAIVRVFREYGNLVAGRHLSLG